MEEVDTHRRVCLSWAKRAAATSTMGDKVDGYGKRPFLCSSKVNAMSVSIVAMWVVHALSKNSFVQGGRRARRKRFVLGLSRFISCRPMLELDSEHLRNLLGLTQVYMYTYAYMWVGKPSFRGSVAGRNPEISLQ